MSIYTSPKKSKFTYYNILWELKTIYRCRNQPHAIQNPTTQYNFLFSKNSIKAIKKSNRIWHVSNSPSILPHRNKTQTQSKAVSDSVPKAKQVPKKIKLRKCAIDLNPFCIIITSRPKFPVKIFLSRILPKVCSFLLKSSLIISLINWFCCLLNKNSGALSGFLHLL